MKNALRAVVVLLVLVGVALAAAEWFVRGRVSEIVADETRQSLDGLDGVAEVQGSFEPIEVGVEGLALAALARGSFDAVTIDTGSGTVEGLPIRSLSLRAAGVATDGSGTESLTVEGRLDAADLVGRLADPESADQVAASARAVPPDAVAVEVPVEIPFLGLAEPVLVDVEIALSPTAEGNLVVEPRSISTGEVDVDTSQLEVVRPTEISAEELPMGLGITAVRVEDSTTGPVIIVTARCREQCPLVAAAAGGGR